MSRRIALSFVLSFFILIVALPDAHAASAGAWPERVLITNDNGIHDPKIWALARAFALSSDVFVVAAETDRSGSSNYHSLGRDRRAITVRRVFSGKRLSAYELKGYPADCVAFGVLGLLKNDPPDLVVSGINGGPNLGMRSWFGSGTIGAARTAALLGIPAIAVSGLDDDDREMMNEVTLWVVAFAHSEMVRKLKPGQYFTVAVPRVSADKIRGVRIAPPTPAAARLVEFDRVSRTRQDGDEVEIWVGKATGRHPKLPAGSDAALYHAGYIVITPRRIGEVDKVEIPVLRKELRDLPEWPGEER